MRRSLLARGSLLGLLGALAVPAVAAADTLDAAKNGVLPDSVAINSIWVIVAGCLVMFMQAGFAFLEIGFSRGKNAGTVSRRSSRTSRSPALMYWAVGFAFAFGAGDDHRPRRLLPARLRRPARRRSRHGRSSDATIESKWFFQFVFCAVSLAIVWGTTLERIKFGVYIIYAIVFAGVHLPDRRALGLRRRLARRRNFGMQDFAGSTAVHLIGATGAFAALLLLGPRRGKYGTDGKPRAIPGHNMPLFGLGVLILWLGWFGFNPGSTLQRAGRPLPGDRDGHATSRPPPACSAAVATAYWKTQGDRHRHGRQRRDRRARRDHGAVGLRRAVGGADHRRRRRRDRRARRLAIDK